MLYFQIALILADIALLFFWIKLTVEHKKAGRKDWWKDLGYTLITLVLIIVMIIVLIVT